MPNRFYAIERPRKKETLPEVLSKEKVLAMINCTNNLKHRCIIKLLYSAGLRRSELINLKITDIESDRMLIKISGAKGNKDRYTLLSQNLLKDLRAYYREYKPTQYLIEGPNGNKYSGTSIANVVKKAAQKAKIKKHVKPHMLRHSRVGGPINAVNLREFPRFGDPVAPPTPRGACQRTIMMCGGSLQGFQGCGWA